MRAIIDTNIAVHLLDGDRSIAARLAQLPVQPAISIMTRVELEGGIHRDPQEAQLLRARVDLLLGQLEQLPFREPEAVAYGSIVERCGYSRPRIVDRMIAATAIVADATLMTVNGDDFREIPGLKLEIWPSPTQ